MAEEAQAIIYRALRKAERLFLKDGFGVEAAESQTLQAENRARENFQKEG